jgi:uncharacterized protein YgiM (DUF1202 family)
MNKIFTMLCLLVGLLILFPGTGLADTMFAKKDRVKVTAKKSPTSKVIAILRLGDQVEVFKKSGRQYQVKLGSGKTGWVFKFKLAKEKPTRGKEGGSSLSGLTGKKTIVAREARAGGSIRGLKETTEQYAKKKQISPAHQKSVDKMEEMVIPDDELARFQKEEGVGEYGGGA